MPKRYHAINRRLGGMTLARWEFGGTLERAANLATADAERRLRSRGRKGWEWMETMNKEAAQAEAREERALRLARQLAVA